MELKVDASQPNRIVTRPLFSAKCMPSLMISASIANEAVLLTMA